jgi:hypothetical protein
VIQNAIEELPFSGASLVDAQLVHEVSYGRVHVMGLVEYRAEGLTVLVTIHDDASCRIPVDLTLSNLQKSYKRLG